jgi:hypothetical protein
MTRTSRRWLVLGLVALCTALVFLGLLGVKGPVWFVLIGLLVAEDGLLLYVTSQVAELPEGAVDERQAAVRNRAYRLAYRIIMHTLVWPTVVIVVLISFGDPHGWLAAIGKNTPLILAVGVCGTQLVAFLPTMILAWSEPDLVESD